VIGVLVGDGEELDFPLLSQRSTATNALRVQIIYA
jgi:hypothetical protein